MFIHIKGTQFTEDSGVSPVGTWIKAEKCKMKLCFIELQWILTLYYLSNFYDLT